MSSVAPFPLSADLEDVSDEVEAISLAPGNPADNVGFGEVTSTDASMKTTLVKLSELPPDLRAKLQR